MRSQGTPCTARAHACGCAGDPVCSRAHAATASMQRFHPRPTLAGGRRARGRGRSPSWGHSPARRYAQVGEFVRDCWGISAVPPTGAVWSVRTSGRTRSSRPCRKSCLTNRPRLPRRGKARTLRRARTSRQRPTPEAASTFGDKVNNSPSASREGSVRQTRAGNGGLLVAAAPAVGVCRKIQHLIERPALAIGGEGKTARCALLAFGSLHRHP